MPYTGQYCNEYYKLKREFYTNEAIKIVAYILFGISLITIIGIILYSTHPEIKAGS